MALTLKTAIREYVRACFAGIWIRSDEHDDALATISAVCRDEGWRLAAWDVDAGLRLPDRDDSAAAPEAHDPLAAVRLAGRLAQGDAPALLVLANFHRFLPSAEVAQATARQVQLGKSQRTFVIVLAPLVDLPPELEKLFVVIEHELPDRDQLATIAREIADEPAELPVGDALGAVRVLVVNSYTRAGGGKRPSDGGADALARSGYNGNLIFQPNIHSITLRKQSATMIDDVRSGGQPEGLANPSG